MNLWRWIAGLLAALGAAPLMAQPELRCTLELPAVTAVGQPLPARFSLHNPGPEGVALLPWGTPFEGSWLGASVEVIGPKGRLPYQGPQVKRAAPRAEHYLRLAPGQTVTVELDLSAVFALDRPGRYRVRPRIQAPDVLADTAADLPWPRAEPHEQRLCCPEVRFQRRAAPR